MYERTDAVAAIPTGTRPGRGALAACEGAIFVEFLIAFLPVYVFFLCLLQLGLLFTVKLLTEHAAVSAARAAAVVLADDPKHYAQTQPHELREPKAFRQANPRVSAVRSAAVLALLPLILNGSVQTLDVLFPPAEEPGGVEQGKVKLTPMGDQEVSKVRVRIEATVLCRISFANWLLCSPRLTAPVSAEAIYPYQGAYYDYPPG
jgi:hypothetical protein